MKGDWRQRVMLGLQPQVCLPVHALGFAAFAVQDASPLAQPLARLVVSAGRSLAIALRHSRVSYARLALTLEMTRSGFLPATGAA